MWESTDGGQSWNMPFRFGGDNHAMWIDPNDSDHMVLGYDHGMGITYDGGKTWYHPDEKPLAQFYAVDVDMAYPYNVYGGLQDNGSVKGPSTMRNGGAITMEQWSRVGGGDGMYNVPDKSNNRYLYNEYQFGPIQRVDLETGETKDIRYKNHRKMRWNWNSPIIVSQHNSDVIYHAGNKVLKSASEVKTGLKFRKTYRTMTKSRQQEQVISSMELLLHSRNHLSLLTSCGQELMTETCISQLMVAEIGPN